MNIPKVKKTIRAEPLTVEAFSAFGQVVEHQGEARRHFLPAVFAAAPQTTTPMAWVNRMRDAVSLPLLVSRMERHLHSAQTFIPLTSTPYVVIVAGNLPDGNPDMASARAFIANPRQGVCYHRGTWHFGLSPLSGDAEFFVLMSKSSTATMPDDEFLALSQCYEIVE